MSDSVENAIAALNEHITKTFYEYSYIRHADEKPLLWDDIRKEFPSYTIDVYDINQVVESEVS